MIMEWVIATREEARPLTGWDLQAMDCGTDDLDYCSFC